MAAIEPTRGRAGISSGTAGCLGHDLLNSKSPAKSSLEDFIDDCEAGLRRHELTSYYFPTIREYLRGCAPMLSRGLEVSGTAVGNDFCFPAERACEIAGSNAGSIARPSWLHLFRRPHGTSERSAKLAVSAIEECRQYAGDMWRDWPWRTGGLTATADGLLDLVKQYKALVGVNLDRDFTVPYAELAASATITAGQGTITPWRTRHRLFWPYLASWPMIWLHLLEFEENESPRDACRRYVDEMRTAFEAV